MSALQTSLAAKDAELLALAKRTDERADEVSRLEQAMDKRRADLDRMGLTLNEREKDIGARNDALKAKEADVAARLPQGRLQRFDGLGHFGPCEAPAQVASSIVAAFGERAP